MITFCFIFLSLSSSFLVAKHFGFEVNLIFNNYASLCNHNPQMNWCVMTREIYYNIIYRGGRTRWIGRRETLHIHRWLAYVDVCFKKFNFLDFFCDPFPMLWLQGIYENASPYICKMTKGEFDMFTLTKKKWDRRRMRERPKRMFKTLRKLRLLICVHKNNNIPKFLSDRKRKSVT